MLTRHNQDFHSYDLDYNPILHKNFELLQSNEHALIAVSPFNGYFSIENMRKLFFWAQESFVDFHVFTMEEASVYNLMAMGYAEEDAFKKTKKYDRHLHNKIIRILVEIGFDLKTSQQKILPITQLYNNKRYNEIYNLCLKYFAENVNFTRDCLETTQAMLENKVQNLSEDKLYLAVQYLLKELPVWFNTPYILNIKSSTYVYKDFSYLWQRICYDYNLMAQNQSIFVKNVS